MHKVAAHVRAGLLDVAARYCEPLYVYIIGAKCWWVPRLQDRIFKGRQEIEGSAVDGRRPELPLHPGVGIWDRVLDEAWTMASWDESGDQAQV